MSYQNDGRKDYIKSQDLRAMLAGNWDSVLADLAPSLGKALMVRGRHVLCPMPNHNDNDPSFRLDRNVADQGSGICSCKSWSNGIDLLKDVNGWDYTTTRQELMRWLGISDSDAQPAPRAMPEPLPPDPEELKRQEEEDRQILASMNRYWSESVALTAPEAEPARLYCVSRHIDFRAIPEVVWRYHSAMPWQSPDGKRKGKSPCLLAKVIQPDGTPATLHRTYISNYGSKADIPCKTKKLYKRASSRPASGGAIRFDNIDEEMAVAEGIETILSVRQMVRVPCWATVSDKMMANLVLPVGLKRLYVYTDKDRSEAGYNAGVQLCSRAREAGVQAIMVTIPDSIPIPRDQKSIDWNDIHRIYGQNGFLPLDQLRRACEQNPMVSSFIVGINAKGEHEILPEPECSNDPAYEVSNIPPALMV